MKKIIIFCCCLFLFWKISFSQSQWSVNVPGSTVNLLASKFDPADGSTVNVGRISAGNDDDCFIAKISNNGAVLWQRQLRNIAPNFAAPRANEVFNKVIICNNGDYVAVGNYISNGNIRGIVCRFNSVTGLLIWARVTNYTIVNIALGQVFNDVIETTGGNIAIAGARDWNNNVGGFTQGVILLLNNNGQEQWCREHVTANNDIFTSIHQLNNNIYTIGMTDGNTRKNICIGTFNEFTGANPAPAYRTFTITANSGTYNNNINSLWPYKSIADPVNNSITIGAGATTGWGSPNSVNCIFNYNITANTMNGVFFYHTGTTSANSFTFSQIGANDYLVGERVTNGTGLNTYFARYQNANLIYDRQITNSQGPLGDIDIFSGNFSMVGTNVNAGYILKAPITLPLAGANLCGVINSPVILTPNPAAPTAVADASNSIAIANATIIANPNIVVPIVTIGLICGTPIPCPSDTTYTVTKCANQSIQLNARAGSTYAWSPSTGLSSTTIQSPICNVTTNTTYTVTVTNTVTNCTYRDNINVMVNPTPVSNIPDTSLCLGDTIQLNAPLGYSYNWTPATNINNTTISNPLVWPNVTTTYVVTLTSAAGCIGYDTVKVTVNDCHCEDPCSWSLTGNLLVKPSNFIGSINNADFKIRTNNTQRMVVSALGNIGLNTATPAKLLDVNGEAAVRNLPAAALNDKLVFANNAGELKSLQPGATNQYLSGNGTWQNLPTGGGTVTNADQGVTLEGSTVLLGDYCGKGSGKFKSFREINMNDNNLYFNSDRNGKLYMGNTSSSVESCKDLFARLEISSVGLRASNDYISPNSSTSGLRFTDLTAKSDPIDNRYNGVLSLDEDGDVIWVNTCCVGLQGKNDQITSILERLDKLEMELKAVKNENVALKTQLNKTEITLEYRKNILEQNVPNPFTETTSIGYAIVPGFSKAIIVFNASNGAVIKTVQLNNAGKGQISISANLVAKGIYTYSLYVDGKLIETKKMIKE